LTAPKPFCYFLTMKKILPLLPLLLSGILFSSPCPGAEPEMSGLQPIPPNGVFSTFGAQVIEEGKTAVSLSVERASEPSFYRLSTHIGYGFGEGIELSLSVPYIIDGTDGLEDTAIGLKHRFFSEGKYGPSVAYLLTASLITGRDELSADGHLGAGLAISKRVGPVEGHVSAIYSTPGKSELKDQFVFSAGFDFSAAHNFKILGELYGKKSYYSKDVDQLELRLGYRFLLGEGTFATLGAGIDLKDGSPQYRVIFSLSGVFPKEKRPVKKVYEEAD